MKKRRAPAAHQQHTERVHALQKHSEVRTKLSVVGCSGWFARLSGRFPLSFLVTYIGWLTVQEVAEFLLFIDDHEGIGQFSAVPGAFIWLVTR